MVWHKVKTWNEAAFVSSALPELTSAMGLYLVLNDLDHYQESEVDFGLIDPNVVAGLRRTWLDRVNDCFPKAWHPAIANSVALTENFHLALVSHVDQVRFSVRAPRWINVVRALAVAVLVLAVCAIAVVVMEPFGAPYTRLAVILAEGLPILGAMLGLAAALGRDKYRSDRALRVSENLRNELRGAIAHSFARPVSRVASDMVALKELSLELNSSEY